MARDPEELLVKAFAALEREDAGKALELADSAIEGDPELAAAHQARALALAGLLRGEDAAEAFGRAVELDPDDPDVLFDAAEFFVCSGDADLVEQGLELAQSGRQLAEEDDDLELVAELFLIEAMGLNALGQHEDALEAAKSAGEELGERADVLAEEGSALFELSRFAEARATLERAVKLGPDDAWVQHLLGLVLERAGERYASEQRFARARELAPDDFPTPVHLSSADFDAALREAVALLPEEIRGHVATALVSVKELPDEHDLREHQGDHPLSPLMLGLFRGQSLRDAGATGDLPPAIFLFQRNLERMAGTREELIEQIRVTVLHEVGHLLGLSDEDLHERGLQ